MIQSEVRSAVRIGCSLGGAWLTSLGYFRSDRQIRREETFRADGGATKIAAQLESARIGRLGVWITATAIVLAVVAPQRPAGSDSMSVVVVGALITAAIRMLAAVRSFVFRRWERPAELEVANAVATALRDRERASGQRFRRRVAE